MAGGPVLSVDELAARTPETRDRYMDFLRAFSILIVVVGHWCIGIVYWQDGVIGTRSAIGVTRGLWLLTWVAQVMPIFFFVGGFSNLVSYRSYRARGRTTVAFVRSRVERLLRPSLVFVGIWAVVQVLLHLTDTGQPTTPFLRGMRPPGATVPFGPLWFLGVYLVVVAISPLTIRLHERLGWAAPIAMTVGAVAVDALAFPGGRPGFRWLNVAFVWLLPHQLGHLYADGRLGGWSLRAHAGMAAAGLAAMVLLTTPWAFGEAGERWFSGLGHYPKSLLGTDVEPIANTYPPTIVLVAMTYWSIGVAMLVRKQVGRWLRRDRPWKGVIVVNSVIMTLFLWHMTAFLLAVLLLWPVGFGRFEPAWVWWLERALWIAVPGAILLGLVALFGRFERSRPARRG